MKTTTSTGLSPRALSRNRNALARPQFEALESRLLMAADLPIVALPPPSVELSQAPAGVHMLAPREIVVLDAAFDDLATLRDAIARDSPQAEVLLLDATRDAFDQIGERLAAGEPVSAIHLVAHGQAGQFVIRGAVIDASELARRAAQLQAWNFSDNADILLYGCNVAEGPNGRAFVDMLASLTGADVAASSDLTGHIDLGADWDLEVATGSIDTATIAGPRLRGLWRGTLEATAELASAGSTGVTAVSPPLAFERNVGQVDATVDFLARTGDYSVYLTGGDAVIDMRSADGTGQVVRLSLVGASDPSSVIGENELAAKSHYLVGEASDWHTEVTNHGAVRYDGVYDGIDVRYYGNGRLLQYDFLVAAGASPDAIGLQLEGAKSVTISTAGELVLTLDDAGRTMTFHAPVSYQTATDGSRIAVDSRYVIREDGTVGFALGSHDRTRALVIDPVLGYTSYLGGTGLETIEGTTTDSSGNVYVTGRTGSAAFPTSVGAYDTSLGGSTDAFVSKFDANGTLQYSTFFGGSGNEWAYNLVVDASGQVYVVGETASSDFSIVNGADSSYGGTSDGYLVKLNAAGSAILYSTYYGGANADYLGAVHMGSGSTAYVAGGTTSATWDGYAAAINTGSSGAGSLTWSQTYAAAGVEKLYDMDVDSTGDIWLIGETSTSGLTTGGPYDSTQNGGADVFLVRMSAAGAVEYVTYYGGTGNDYGNAIVVAADNTLYFTGATYSTAGIASTGAYDTTGDGTNGNAFLVHLDPSQTGSAQRLFGTYFGSAGATAALEIELDAEGRPVIVGQTAGTIPTTTNANDTTLSGSTDGFAAVFSDTGVLRHATYLGGDGTESANAVAADSAGRIYVVGASTSTTLHTSGAYDTTGDATNGDGFIAQLLPLGSQATATVGGGLSLNTDGGNDAYLKADDGGAILGGRTELTLEFDFAIDTGAGTDNRLLSYAISGVDNEVSVHITAAGSIVFTIENATTTSASTYAQLLDGDRHQLAITWTRSTGNGAFYVDGALVHSFSGFKTFANIDSGGTLVIGQDQDSVDGGYSTLQMLSGTLYDVRVFSDVRTATEIRAGRLADLPRYESGMVANWRFDDWHADRTTTEAVSGNDLTLGHATGTGFVASHPELTFLVNENTATGTVVGAVTALSDDRQARIDALLAADATLTYSAQTDKFYKLDSTFRTWTSALSLATSTTLNGISGQMVTVHSATENALVTTVASGSAVWLGASDTVTEGAWRWYDGAAASTQFWQGTASGYRINGAYTNFDTGEPSESTGEDRLYLQTNGTWNDAPEVMTSRTVIEWDADEVLDAYTPITYSITSQTVSGAFAIDSDTGTLTVADGDRLNYVAGVPHTLTVRVTEGSLTYDRDYTIVLADEAVEVSASDPGDQSTAEDTSLSFSSGGGNAITVSDASGSDTRLQVSLSVSNGTLTLSQTTGLTIVSGTNGAASLVVDGTESALNAALSGMTYTPTAEYSGADTLQVTASLSADLAGHYTFDTGAVVDSAAGTAQNGSFAGNATTTTDAERGTVLTLDGSGDSVQIASVFGSPTNVTVGGWVNLYNAPTRGEMISLDDRVHIALDEPGVGIKGSVQTGAATWNDLDSGRFIAGDGWHHVMFVVDDTNDINTLYIDGIEVASETNASSVYWTGATTTYFGQHPGGSAYLHGLLDDMRVYTRALSAGEVAALAAEQRLTDLDTIAITVAAVNDAPVNSVPGAQSTTEDTTRVFSTGNGNAITIADSDAAGADNEITLTVTHGSLTLAGTTGLTFVSGDGTADASMTFRGTATAINNALNGLAFAPAANTNTSATLTVATTDSVLLSLDIDTGLAAHYEFAGNADDTGPGTAQNGTLTNGAAVVSDGTRGQVLNLDGTDDFVDLSSGVASVSGLTQGTIAAWVKSTGTFQTIFSISDSADTGSYASLFLGASGYLTYEVYENGAAQLAVYRSSAAINDGNWHHVAVVVDGTGNRLYVDGVEATTGQLTYDTGSASTQQFFANVSSLDAMAIGRNTDSSGGKWYATGHLDDVRLYDHALASAEIATLASDLTMVDADTVAVTLNAVNDAPQDLYFVPGLAESSLTGVYTFSAPDDLGRDDAGGDAPITLYGSPSQTTGPGGGALALAGGASGQYGDIAGITTGGAMTIAGKVRFDSTDAWQRIVDFGQAYSTGITAIYVGRYDLTSDLTFTLEKDLGFGNYATYRATAGGAIANGTWLHFAATVDGSGAMSLYVDGVLAGTAAGIVPEVGVRTNNYVGMSNWGADALFDGAIDDLVIASGALSADDVEALYQQSNASTLAEGAANGTVLGTFVVADPDSGNTHTFSLPGSAGGPLAVAADGTLTVADGSLLDYESSTSQVITVRATDQGSLSQNESFTATLTAVNEAPTFAAGDGKITTSFGSSDDATAVAVQSDGKIVIAGYSGSTFILGRYNADGTLDGSFGTGGIVTTAVGSSAAARSIAIQSDGKILVAGTSFNGVNDDFALVRYNTDGSLDTTFDTDGRVTTAVGAGNDRGMSVAVQSDGRIVVGGYSHNGTNEDFAVVRYTTSGGLDTTFDTDGRVTTAVGTGDDFVADIALQTDGRIVVVGYGWNGANNDFAVVRYTDTGALDTTFDTDGKLLTTIGSGTDQAESVAIQTDGGIVVSGYASNGSNDDFALVRYNADGSLDTTFDTDGKVVTTFGAGTGSEYGSSVAVQTDGRIVVAGRTLVSGNSDFAIARYTTTGALDTTFDTDGKVTTDFSGSGDLGRALAIQGDGKLVVAGMTWTGAGFDVGLTRHLANGALDTGFDSAFVTTLDGAPTHTEGGAFVVLDSSVSVFDPELSALGNYSGATLTLARNGGAQSEDQFVFDGATVTVSGANVLVSGVLVGTYVFTGGQMDVTFGVNATETRVNTLMRNVLYGNASDAPPASVQIDWTFSDGNTGAQGSGGALAATGSTTVSITAVNDAPVNTIPGFLVGHTPSTAAMGDQAYEAKTGQSWGQSFAYDSAGATYTVGDVQLVLYRASDAPAGQTVTVSLRSTWNGAVIASGTVSTDSLSTSEAWVNVVFSSVATLNDSQSYFLRVDSSALEKIYVGVADSGTYAPGHLLDTAGVTQSGKDMAFVLDAPLQTGEETPLTLSVAGGNALSIADADAGSGSLQVSLAMTGGTVTLAQTTGLSFSTGDGTADATLVFSGTLAALNAALDGMTFQPSADFNGVASIALTTSDLGNTGSGGALVDSDTQSILVTATDDPPAFSGLDGTPTHVEGGAAVALDANVTVSDTELTAADDFSGATVTLVRNGGANSDDALAFDGTNVTVSGANVLVGGTQIGTYVFTGGELVVTFGANATQARVNTLLQNIVYWNWSDAPPASVQIDWTFNDGNSGSQGSGSAQSTAGSTTVSITAVNDAPVLNNAGGPVLATVTEDAAAPSGAVGTLVSTLVDFASPAGQVDNVTDADGAADLGIAITDADTANGTWFYSIDNGATWNALGAVGAGNARLLAADAGTRLYFQGNADFAGTITNAITFHAWDRTSGVNGSVADISDDTVLDQFSSVSYANNDGTTNWTSAWVETDVDGGGASSGRLLVGLTGDLEIRARATNNNLYREVDLSGKSTATLSFDFVNTLSSGDTIVVQASGNGGASYTTLTGGTFSSSLNTGSGTFSLDVSSFIAANTRIRFLVSSVGGEDHLYVDNVQVAFPGSTTGGSSAFSLASDTASLTVSAVNDTPTANAGGPYTIAEGATLVLNASGSSDPDGDTLTYAWDLDNDGNYGETGEPITAGPSVSWATLQSFGIDDDGSYTIGLRVGDGTVTVATTTTLTVTNAAPTITVSGAATVAAGQTYTLTVGVTDAGNDAVTSWKVNWGDGTVSSYAGTPTAVTHTFVQGGYSRGITVSVTDEDGSFSPNDVLLSSYLGDRVLRLDGTSGSLEATLPTSVTLDGPSAIAIGPDGYLYVASMENDRIVRYDLSTNTLVGTFVSAGSGGLDVPAALTFGPDGNLYVASYGTNQILEYDGTTGAFIGAFASLNSANVLTWGPDGYLYAGSWFTGEVRRFDIAGNAVDAGAFLTLGGGFGVSSLTFGTDGFLYVGDGNLFDLLKYNATSGALVGTIDSSIAPYGLANGPDGTLFVADFNNDWVERFRLDTGASLGRFDDGATGVNRPWGLAFNPSVLVAVTAGTPGVTLSAMSGSTSEAGGTATFSIVLDSAPTAPVTIALSSGDASEGTLSTSSVTFTVSNWNTAQTVTVTGVDDVLGDGDVTYSIVTGAASSADASYSGFTVADVSVTNVDNDTSGVTVSAISGNTTEAGGTATFTVVLNAQPTANVTIAVSTGDASEGSVSTSLLTFTSADWNVAQTVTVTGVDDALDDGDVSYSIVTGAASSADPGYNGLAVGDVSVTNVDDDASGVTVSAISGNTTEAGGTANFTVVLNAAPTADVTISIDTSDNTEGVPSTSQLTFTSANWNVAQSVTVTGVDDGFNDGNVTFSIVTGTVSSADSNYNGVTVADVSVTNIDDDGPSVVASAISASTTEAGGTGSFTVVLDTQPTADVTISIATGDATEGSVSTSLLIFNPGNWNVAQVVTVTGVDDLLDDGDVIFSIVTGAAFSTDPDFDGLSVADVTVTNTDNDASPVNAGPVGVVLAEDGTFAFTGADSLSVSDADGDLQTVALSVSSGVLSLSLAGGATLSTGALGTSALTISGTLAALNSALGSLTYSPAADFNGGDTLLVTSTDAIGLSDTDSFSLTISPVDDAPVLTGMSLSVAQGGSITLAPTDFAVSDPDGQGGTRFVDVRNVSDGSFEIASAPGNAVSTFAFADVIAGLVRFVHSGSSSAPAFEASVRDSVTPGTFVAASVGFTPTPVLIVPGPTQEQVYSVLLTNPGTSTPSAPANPSAPTTPSQPTSTGTATPRQTQEESSSAQGERGTGEVDPRVLMTMATPRTPQVPAAPAPDPGAAAVAVAAAAAAQSASAAQANVSNLTPMPTGITPAPAQVDPVQAVSQSTDRAGWEMPAPLSVDLPPATAEETRKPSQEEQQFDIMVNGVRLTGVSLSVGVVTWALRAGGIISSLLASLPAWRYVDPLPILERAERSRVVWRDDEDENPETPDGSESETAERAVTEMLEGRS